VGLEEVARSLGRRPLAVRLRVTLPLVAPGLAAAFCLVFISAVALGSMLTSTAVLHFGYAGRRFDTFRALHEPLVVGLFFGLGVLWLLPPHPWEMEPAQSDWKKRRSDRAKAAA